MTGGYNLGQAFAMKLTLKSHSRTLITFWSGIISVRQGARSYLVTASIPHFIALHGCCDFYKLIARASTSKKIRTHFTLVIWNRSHTISKACLYVEVQTQQHKSSLAFARQRTAECTGYKGNHRGSDVCYFGNFGPVTSFL